MTTLDDLKRIAEVEFADIVKSCIAMDFKIRFILSDNSFIDVHLAQRLPQKFGFHWECRDQEGTFYRYDNFPDKNGRRSPPIPYTFMSKNMNLLRQRPSPPQ
jgi:hypothetical protein